MMASAGLHARPATGLSNARAHRRRAVKSQKIVTQLVTTAPISARPSATIPDCCSALSCTKQTQPDRLRQNLRACGFVRVTRSHLLTATTAPTLRQGRCSSALTAPRREAAARREPDRWPLLLGAPWILPSGASVSARIRPAGPPETRSKGAITTRTNVAMHGRERARPRPMVPVGAPTSPGAAGGTVAMTLGSPCLPFLRRGARSRWSLARSLGRLGQPQAGRGRVDLQVGGTT